MDHRHGARHLRATTSTRPTTPRNHGQHTADAETCRLIGAINDPASQHTVMAERALLAALGGTCHSPIAVLTAIDGDQINMRASLFSSDGLERVDGTMRFAAEDLDAAADLGAQATCTPAWRERTDRFIKPIHENLACL